jgi:hypothetical protein
MAKDNIYDLIISELILRLEASDIEGGPTLTLVSSLDSPLVPTNFNENVIFTSILTNIPTGYSITASSHVITYPTMDPPTVGSDSVVSGSPTPVILGSVGSTFVVTSTITLEHATESDIILNAIYTITTVEPTYFGVKAFSLTPDTIGLDTIASTSNTFQMTTSILGRLYVVTPLGVDPIISITDHNGLVYTIADDFTVSTSGGFTYYILNYDTQLTGTNIKTFTINFN